MKKIVLAGLLFTAAACSNSSSNDTTDNGTQDSVVKTAPAVDNVNGHIPDSTNTIDVGTNDSTVNQ